MLDGVPPDTRVVIADVTWEFYESFVDAIADGENLRVAFDGNDIEVMTLGPFHESLGAIVAVFIATIATEMGVEHQPVGSTTWKRKKVKRGVESDLCYYFDPAKLVTFAEAFARRSNKLDDYPNPDLAIEIAISRSKIDRPGIYAVLEVPELWRFHKERFSIESSRRAELMRRRAGAASWPYGPQTSALDLERTIAKGARVAKAAARVGSTRPRSPSEWVKTNAAQACILTHELPSLAARGFRRCLGWPWRGIGVGELEVDRAGGVSRPPPSGSWCAYRRSRRG